MAVMPLSTLVMAHFFVAGEAMTRLRTMGFVLGLGPQVAKAIQSNPELSAIVDASLQAVRAAKYISSAASTIPTPAPTSRTMGTATGSTTKSVNRRAKVLFIVCSAFMVKRPVDHPGHKSSRALT